MRIGLQTWGTEGDVRPFIALAGGLVNSGHQVHLVVTSIDQRDYTRYAEQLGFQLTTAGMFDWDQEYIIRTVRDILMKHDFVSQLVAIFNTFMVPVLDEMFGASEHLVATCDLVIGHSMVVPLGVAAEVAGSPYAHAATVTGVYPSQYFTPIGAPDLGVLMNRVWWWIGDIQINYLFRSVVNAFRRRHGLPPIRSVLHEVWRSPVLNLAAVSPALCPPMPDWDRTVKICGFFSLPTVSDAWEMPESLGKFLKAGSPPVFMTFGSMVAFDSDVTATVNLCIEAAKLAGCRAIIQTDWRQVPDVAPDASIFRLSNAPHRHLFPRCAAVVHHGGAGTTQAATLAGLPSVIVAHGADQPLWGAVLHRKNIAPPLLFKRNVTSKKLARAMSLALSSPDMSANARRIGARMSEEKGVEEAVSHIEDFLRTRT